MGPSVGSPTGWTRLAAPEPSWLDSRVGHVFPAISVSPVSSAKAPTRGPAAGRRDRGRRSPRPRRPRAVRLRQDV